MRLLFTIKPNRRMYTYGRFTPDLVLDMQNTPVSALHLITSPGGGLATFISPQLPADRGPLPRGSNSISHP
ncbi:hypothetical protein CWS02_14695 [Enterobacter sp. EA-1]|nr:hypothetical protein CWS02_14695 [Enterobacter sp. EA-1]